MKNSLNIVWFKKDLRLQDHKALHAACNSGGKVLLLYVHESAMWKHEGSSKRHENFAKESVSDLSMQLFLKNKKLTVLQGHIIEVLNHLKSKFGSFKLWSHEETGNLWSYQRDMDVLKWAKSCGIEWHEVPSNGVFRGLKTRDGWADLWKERMAMPLLPVPDLSNIVALDSNFSLETTLNKNVQRGGRQQALAVLDDFLSVRGKKYRGGISSPNIATTACSRLSPYLAWGCLSMREVVNRLENRVEELKLLTPKERKGWLGSLRDFKSRLFWHCHFIQKLEIIPDIEAKNIHSAYDGLRENNFNSEHYQRWCEGQTGFPFIDACMRYLNRHGWINFRMRAMLVSFATNNLWLHWKPVALHLGRQFTDYEPGIHYSQIQMQAGTTGINAPRIYNPVKQGVDQDPDGLFIRCHVPELKKCKDSQIHTPWETAELANYSDDYPRPIIDHLETYKTARKKLGGVRKKNGFKEEADSIRELIASRKRNK
ncbi:MAG: DNA photolyase family protein [Lentisphaeraceae bacterium]|nr:DNA photolyase family protein [Lentisphaeraceae bacterium]